MKTGSCRSHETPAALVTATGSWIKTHQPLLKGPLDWGVVANLEMEAINLLITPPVAPPEVLGVFDAQRHGHRFVQVTTVGIEQNNMLRQ